MDERKRIERETIEKLRMHFVFNSPNGIHHMIGKDTEIAREMVYDLSVVMRAYVDMITCEGTILLEEELKVVESYVRLQDAGRQTMRFETRGKVQGDIKAGEILNVVVAKMKEEIISPTLFYRIMVALDGGVPTVEIMIGEN